MGQCSGFGSTLVLSVLALVVLSCCVVSADVIFQEDFEFGLGEWQIDNGVWGIGSPTGGTSHTGQSCAKTNLGGNYPNSTDSRLIAPTTTLPVAGPGEEIQLRFWHAFNYESGYDYGQVHIQVKQDNGTWGGWLSLGTMASGSNGTWHPGFVNLTSYSGKTVRVAFFHAADGTNSYSGWTIDDVSVESPLDTISLAKAYVDDGHVNTKSNLVVTAAFSGYFYVESQDRLCGLRVATSAFSVGVGSTVSLGGTMQTAATGERYLQADWVSASGSGTIGPLGMPNGNIGGSGWHYSPVTGAGQCGVLSGTGLNNVGLLISTWGRVTAKGTDYLYIDDGTELRDGTMTLTQENVGVRVVCAPSSWQIGDQLAVRGISSCFRTPSGETARQILIRSSSDVRKF